MTGFEGQTYSEGTVEYTIHEHITVLDNVKGRETPWRKEINLVSWNGGLPKIDIRDWSEDHTRMSRGVTLTEAQAEKMTMAIVQRFRTKAEQNLSAPAKDHDMAR